MNGDDVTAQLAGAILAFRRHRAQVLPSDIFGEPAWELMLDLFVADAHGHRLTGRAVANRSNIPGSVMSRWLKYLTAEGLLVGDGDGNLDDSLTLSGIGMERIEKLLRHAKFITNEYGSESRTDLES